MPELGLVLPPMVLPGEVLPGEVLDPPAALEPVEPAPCSRRQRSFSKPVSRSHCVFIREGDALGEVVLGAVGEVVLGEPEGSVGVDAPAVPLAEVPGPPSPDEDDWASAAAENANSAATVAVESAFDIVASPM